MPGRYPRTARLNALIQEIVADELERVDDDRLAMVTVMAVDVEPDLRHATVWFSTLADDDRDDEILEAFAEKRPALQKAIARQARTKRTPELAFRPDSVARTAARLEEIIHDLHEDDGGAAPDEP
jgi:ribosome-binding factor A